MKYLDYTVEDFIDDEDFVKWVRNPDDRTSQKWTALLEKYPQKRSAFEEARQIILSFQIEGLISEEEEAEEWGRLMNRINVDHPTKKFGISNWFLKVAAILLPLIVIVFAIIYYADKAPVNYQTGIKERKSFILPDKSQVFLNHNSELVFKNNESENIREAWLNGEAYFEIQEQMHPQFGKAKFVVHSGNVAVEVLGTSFNVRNKDDEVMVILKSGKVQLSVQSDSSDHVLLSPGDLASISHSGEVNIIQVNPEYYTAWRNEEIKLESIPLADLAHLLEYSYNVDVVIKEPQLYQEKFEGTLFLNEDMDLMLSILRESFGEINIINEDNTVIFKRY